MCLIMLEVYLNMLSGKIITPNPVLSRIIISSAPSKINPERIREATKAVELDLTREEWYRLLIAARGEPVP